MGMGLEKRRVEMEDGVDWRIYIYICVCLCVDIYIYIKVSRLAGPPHVVIIMLLSNRRPRRRPMPRELSSCCCFCPESIERILSCALEVFNWGSHGLQLAGGARPARDCSLLCHNIRCAHRGKIFVVVFDLHPFRLLSTALSNEDDILCCELRGIGF